MGKRRLYLLKNYDIYEEIDNSEEIIFYLKKSKDDFKPLMRFTFRSNQKSMFNEKYPAKKIDNLKVIRFHKIENYFFTASGEDYTNNINQGYMTASFCYLILHLLRDKRLAEIDFEINLVNRASVIKNGSQESKPDIYDKLLGNHSKTAIEDEFKVFFVANRKKDIKYYKKILKRKKIVIKKNISIRRFFNAFKRI